MHAQRVGYNVVLTIHTVRSCLAFCLSSFFFFFLPLNIKLPASRPIPAHDCIPYHVVALSLLMDTRIRSFTYGISSLSNEFYRLYVSVFLLYAIKQFNQTKLNTQHGFVFRIWLYNRKYSEQQAPYPHNHTHTGWNKHVHKWRQIAKKTNILLLLVPFLQHATFNNDLPVLLSLPRMIFFFNFNFNIAHASPSTCRLYNERC